MGAVLSILSKVAKAVPVVLKWVVQVGPLVYEGVKWGVKIVKELKKKPTNPTVK